jgi:Protein of unknown function (DUF732)
MTLATALPAGPRHARREPPAAAVPTPRSSGLSGGGTAAHAAGTVLGDVAGRFSRPAGQGRQAGVPGPVSVPGLPFGFPGEPPAGLGPWVPPLPAPERGLSRAAGACLAVLVLAVVAVTAVVVSTGMRSTVAASSLDTTYVTSVRDNSTITSRDASDADLVGEGHAVCDALDANPSRLGVTTVFGALTRATGWASSDAAAVVGSAIGAYCPQHRTLIGR